MDNIEQNEIDGIEAIDIDAPTPDNPPIIPYVCGKCMDTKLFKGGNMNGLQWVTPCQCTRT